MRVVVIIGERTMKKLVLASMLVVFATSCSSASRSVELSHKSVSITNLRQNSGGSGVIIDSAIGKSHVLTNGHVCGVVVHGGVVTTEYGIKALVSSYKLSQFHDLCLIEVLADLGGNTEIADEAPEELTDATIAGHPKLYPLVLTKGHTSGTQSISVMIGVRKCTEAEAVDGLTRDFCNMFGVVPLVKTYSALLVTATIMAGSSGSGIYDDQNKLIALVFAGEGQLSYAFAVPYEYIHNFLTVEAKTLESNSPNYTVLFAQSSTESLREYEEKITQACSDPNKSKAIQKLCNSIKNSIIFNE